MNNYRTTVVILSIFIVFILGMVVGQNGLLIARVFIPSSSYSPPDQTIASNIANDADAREVRQALIHFLWASALLPDARPVTLEAALDDEWADMPYLATVEQMVVQQDYGLDSIILWFEPTTPSGIFVVYHQGHGGSVALGREAISDLLHGGATVAALTMPLIGDNPTPVVDVPPFGHVRLEKHEQFALLEAQDVPQHPLRLFITPVIAVVNEAMARGFTDVRMIGISGGGWTTTIAAALDTRIVRSVPVAGSLPLVLRDPSRDWGDYEQHHPTLYSIATYADLYVLGAWESHRSQVQVLHTEDPCCYRGDERSDMYAAGVAQTTSGRWSLLIVESNEHRVGSEAVASVLE